MADQWNHTALLVIDMQVLSYSLLDIHNSLLNLLPILRFQKDFIDEGSPFAIPGARAILPSVYRAVEIARKRGVFVIWVCYYNSSSSPLAS